MYFPIISSSDDARLVICANYCYECIVILK